MGHNHDLLQELAAGGRSLREAIPDAYSGFAQFTKGTMGDGAGFDAAQKEAIALALAVAEQCDGCIAAHARSAVRKGTTPQQVADALAVAMMMKGGPGTVYAPRAWMAYQEFASA